jgi:tripartite-type tricarboxylate transporter receptor subunit TctC
MLVNDKTITSDLTGKPMNIFKHILIVLSLVPFLSMAQSYPNKTVKIIVPFAAGGPADNYARFIAQRLQDELKQSFIVEDKPGAGSIIGTDFAAKSPADGYTLLMMSNTQTVNESLVPNKPFQLMRDFVAVAPINYSDLVLVINPKVPVKNLAELLALAKASPGKLNYASSGNGTPYHMAGELFKSMAGVNILHIPYKGSSGARTDVIGGQVDMMFDAVTTMSEFVKENKVIALATSGKNRSSIMPNVPTVNEAGVPKYETSIWLGIMAPKGTPNEIIHTLNVAIKKIIEQQEVKDLWAKQGALPMVMSPAEFNKYLETDIAKWAAIVKSAGIKPD